MAHVAPPAATLSRPERSSAAVRRRRVSPSDPRTPLLSLPLTEGEHPHPPATSAPTLARMGNIARRATVKLARTAVALHRRMSESLSPIHHTLAPLATLRQVWTSSLLLLRPWQWREGSAREQLRATLEEHFGQSCALFSSGREALLAALRSLDLSPGEEVILPGYTCVVLPNAVHALGGAPLFVDIERDTVNIDPLRVEAAMGPRVRAVVCQHTFGTRGNTQALRRICDAQQCALIEDCAHAVPEAQGDAGSDDARPGELGDYVILSFGRDKVVSGVSGGAVLTRHVYSGRRLRELEDQATTLPTLTVVRLLAYPLLMALARPLYSSGLGKAFLWLCRKLHVLLPIYAIEEKQGHAALALHKLPNALAELARKQWRTLASLQTHRRKLTSMYRATAEIEGWQHPRLPEVPAPLIRFPLLFSNAHALREKLKEENIHLDDGWCGSPLAPPGCDLTAAGYIRGTCPNAQRLSQTILSFPTHPLTRPSDARRAVAALREVLGQATAPIDRS